MWLQRSRDYNRQEDTSQTNLPFWTWPSYFSISNLQGITKMMSTNILPETDLLEQIWNYWYFSRGKQDRELCIQPVYNKIFVSQLQKLETELWEMNWHQFPWMKWLWIISFLKIKQRCDLTGDELGGCTIFPQTLRHNTCLCCWYDLEGTFKHSCIGALIREKILSVSV